jgi:7,8-dihydropterin-6-yl-methyl-4-(beta-D-ribofuranosyl)aminobenzene 5'-phosphate synthase
LIIAILILIVALLIAYPARQETFSNILYPSHLEIGYVKNVEITILVDNHPNGKLCSPWGLSLYIEADGLKILFDAGPDPEALKKNAELLGVDLAALDLVVVSHRHGDHIAGLPYIAEVNKGLKVYVPSHMGETFKNWIRSLGFNLIEVDRTVRIANGVAVIGEFYGPPYKQALAINVENLGLIILVGCSHPGVENIVAKAVKDLKVKPYAVIGGFHLSGASRERVEEVADRLVENGLEKIYPIHCSGEEIRRLLSEKYPETYGDGKVGLKLSFG